LIRAANRAGGIDNITAVVLDVQEGSSEEAAAAPRPASERRGGSPAARRSVRKAGVAALIVVAVLVLLGIGGRVYLHSQWYVGVAGDGYVAVFQGVPAKPLGIHLSSLQTEYKDLSAADVGSFDIYKELPDGITANSRSDAEAIVTQMRADVLTQRAIKGGPGPTSPPAASPSIGAAS
jgi:protein phosphatase